MVKSMTGFGKKAVSFDSGTINVELKTFNHKFCDLSCKLSENLYCFEKDIKKRIRKQITRGKVYIWINYERALDDDLNLIVDKRKLKRYYSLLQSIKQEFALKDGITLTHLLSFSGIIVPKHHKENKILLRRFLLEALDSALENLVKMRQKEGNALYKDVIIKVKNIEKSLQKINVYVPEQIYQYEQRLKQKLSNLIGKEELFKDRLQTEVSVFAKNCDVNEELSRLSAHVENLKDTLLSNVEVGKMLDFIAQEAQREVNTIGAKSSDCRIAKEVILIKAEIEKIREQVQNVE